MLDEDRPRQSGTAVRWLLIVGIILGLLVLLTTPFWLFNGDDDRESEPSPQASASAAPAASMCGLKDGDQSIPTTPPAAKWVLVDRTAIPTNRDFGPGKIRQGVPECFARSPIGAVFAAMSVFAAARNDGASADRLSDRLVRPEQRSGKDQDGVVVQFAGFRVDHYDPKSATVTLAVRVTTGPKAGGLASATIDMSWARGDWRTGRLNPGGLSSTAGFVEWSGA